MIYILVELGITCAMTLQYLVLFKAVRVLTWVSDPTRSRYGVDYRAAHSVIGCLRMTRRAEISEAEGDQS